MRRRYKKNSIFTVFAGQDRTENAWTVSTSRCPIQSLSSKALYGTTGGTYSPRVFTKP